MFNIFKPKKKEETKKGIDISRYGNMPNADLFAEFSTSLGGITEEIFQQKVETFGYNEIAKEYKAPAYKQLFDAFVNPFTIVLTCLATVSFFLDWVWAKPGERDLSTVAVIGTMVFLSGILRFVQEYRSGKAAERLKSLVKTTVTVIRSGGEEELDITHVVPGDMIVLRAGDIVPADCRVISSKTLFISQAALTGEAEHMEKSAPPPDAPAIKNPLGSTYFCFMGTNVISGSAIVMALTTGKATYLGSIAKTLTSKGPQSSFDKGMNSVNFLLIRFMAVMVPVVFLINGIGKGDWMDALFFALSVAIGLTPEMLPMIVTTNLARGAVAMARKSTIVKKLNAIQNFGAMDILCTDKTGTLTEDRIVLEVHYNLEGKEDETVLENIYLNSFYQTGLKNLMDVAVINYVYAAGHAEDFNNRYAKVDEMPFDFQRRRMSVVIANKEETRIITKGALEEMLDISTTALWHGNVVPLDDTLKAKARAAAEEQNKKGMRVIGVAYKNAPVGKTDFNVQDEAGMTFVGFGGFLDPPKQSTAAAIKALNDYSVRVKVLTGDNEPVSRFVCNSVGLDIKKVVTGDEIDTLDEDDLREIVEIATVFCRLSPMQKLRIVKALQKNGHTVGFLGDGINDAPSLKVADVGISVDSAVDIAKESADIILLKKDLMVLEEGLIEGRRTFGNIIKYIKMTVSSNFGNVFSVLIASIFLPFLPMLPLQILVQNLLYDISQTAIPWDNMDPEYLKTPKVWDASSIKRFMFYFGPCSSVFDIATFLLMFFFFAANSAATMSLFHSGWFIEGLLSQTLIVHMIRTQKIPFIQSRPGTPLLIMTTLVMAVGVIIPFTKLGATLGLVPLPGIYFGFLAAILLGYCALTQLVKIIYIKKYGDLL